MMGAGYWKGKIPLEPILTEIPKMKVDPDMEPQKKVKTIWGNLYIFPQARMAYANGTVSIEDFGAGETITWVFPHDTQVHYILRGKAEVTYTLESTNHTDKKKMIVEEGDVYIIPRGARVTWKVSPGGPLRKMCVYIPGLPEAQLRPEAVEDLR